MEALKKHIKLQHSCSKNFEIIAGTICFIILIESILVSILGDVTNKIGALNFINLSTTTMLFLVLFLYATSLNLCNLKMANFFRLTRKEYYQSLIIYLSLVSLVLSFIRLISNIGGYLIFNVAKYNKVDVILEKFIFYFLLYFIVFLIFNGVAILSEFYSNSYVLIFLVIAIAFYPLKVYSKLISFFKSENPVISVMIFILLLAILICFCWSLIKGIDIEKVITINEKQNRKKQTSFEGNLLQYMIKQIPFNIFVIIFVLVINYIFKFGNNYVELFLGGLTGALIYILISFYFEKRKLKR